MEEKDAFQLQFQRVRREYKIFAKFSPYSGTRIIIPRPILTAVGYFGVKRERCLYLYPSSENSSICW